MWSLLLALLAAPWSAQGATDDAVERFNAGFDAYLARYWHPPVTIHGIDTTVFDYARMAADAQVPDSDFKRLTGLLAATSPPQERSDRAKAFWINAYNFGAMRLVVEHYPVDSITSFKISWIRHPWSQAALKIGGERYSLSEIEHDILLERFDDPRIIFAVSCAAVSCPDRTAEAFRAERLDQQLDDLIRKFFNNPAKGMHLDAARRAVRLSWILKKDAQLFASSPGGVLGFVARYRPAADQWILEPNVQLTYFEHDWTLNDLAQGGG